MPELIEVERYRTHAEELVGCTVTDLDAPDPWYLKRGLTGAELRAVLPGCTVAGVGRRGKLLLVDLGEVTLGLRFGMTGRLVVDGTASIDRLEYASSRADPAWIRFTLRLRCGLPSRPGGSGDPARALWIVDPRRLGGVELDPDVDALGPDARSITPAQLRAALAGGRAPLKARLMDQSRVAGLGNLLVDETLWRAGLDPARAAGSLAPAELRRLHRHLRGTVEDLIARGGSHTGDLQPARARGATCPRDGAPLQRRTVGGRTTYSCPRHQR